jgi:epoxyqueuosine reductase
MNPMNQQQRSEWIKAQAMQAGFDACGIATADFLETDAVRLEQWLSKGYHGSMQYMENHIDLRLDPRKLVPGAKSVITVLKNYFPGNLPNTNGPKISSYAYGTDYHDVIRAKLNAFLQSMRDEWGEIQGRGFVDSAPVLERSWALRAGLGWIGKNGQLISKQKGSFFFIATLITDLELKSDHTFNTDHCGTCSRCIDACPTDAILPNKVIDGSRCISYLTIENKSDFIPTEFEQKMDGWLFGCDVCQDVCPWNRFSNPHQEPAFEPLDPIMSFDWADWENLTEEKFNKQFYRSPLKRSKFKGILRNLNFIKSS